MLKSFFVAAIVFASLEYFVLKDYFSWILFLSFLLVLLFFSWFFTKKANLTFITLLVPFSAYLLLQIISNPTLKHITTAIASAVVYILFSKRVNKSFLIILSFFEFFVISSFLFAVEFLEKIDKLSASFFSFLLVFFMFYSSIAGVLRLRFEDKFRLFVFSFLTGLILAEFFWIIIKFPFNFVTAGFMLFLVYYLIWDVTIRYFAGSLTKKAAYFSILFFLLILAFIFTIVKLILI